MQIASSRESREWWSVDNVRQKFFSYFEENQHVRLSSNPLIPVGDPNVPLIHNCLKRFKVAIDGSWRHRICYSLRCVTAASDEDVTSFRSDSTYHRLTEILGSWSFGDDIKEKAIGCSFSLLCKIYKLPQSRIYATYCSGDMSSRLSPDNESKKILQKYLEEERILPSMSKADFWMNGECGPCGPCIGFFCNSSDSQEGAGSEICRLVFVEYNRQADGVLVPLETKYVLTGVNLECLAAILQNKKSHYELDNYASLLADIYYHAGPGIENYSGKIGAADTGGVDTAYRLLADHTRVIDVANSPHSQLGIGNEGREYFLKCADIQVMQYGHKVLKIEIDDYDDVLHGVLQREDTLCEGLSTLDRLLQDELTICKKTVVELREQELPFDPAKKKKKKKDVPAAKNEDDVPAVVWYATRVIEFLGRYTPIILKKKDRRCSLVALCNVLLLGGKITLSSDIEKVSEGHLIHLVQGCLLYGDTPMQLEHNLELSESNKQLLGVLPKLPGSLYFDVTFTSPHGFEQTSETALFAFLGVPLHHGWLVDPQDVELSSTITRSSYFKHAYNVAVYRSIQSGTHSGPQKRGLRKEDDEFYSTLAMFMTGSEDITSSTTCAKISSFLEGTQLTPYGFSCLHAELKERQPAVLLWNEKLIIITKIKDKTYVLLNDSCLRTTKTSAVWERLTQVNDGNLFVDFDFVPTDSKIQSELPLMKKDRKQWDKGLVPKDKEDENKEKEESNKVREETEDVEKTEGREEKAIVSMYLKGLVPKDKEDENEEKEKSNKVREETEDVEKTEGREEEKAIVSMYLKGLVPKDKEDENEEKEKSNKVREETEDVEKTEGREEEKAIVSSMRGNFDIRPIDFFGILTHMIHQSNDGPCAFIAVCNVLLLKGSIYFERHETVVSVEYLLDLVSCLLKQSPKMQVYCAEEQTKIWDVVPTLAAGFDMDVIFARTDAFTRTPEWLLIDCLDLNIRHGWIARNFGPGASFERLTLAANEPGFQDAEMVKNFLRGHQLTTVGLISLHEDLLEKVPYILYWNHHYNTVVKVDGVLHTLATSSNYLRTPVVWQTLDDVNGAGLYLDTNFKPIYPELDAALLGSNIDAESTFRASTSTMNPDPEGDTPHGDGFCLDHIITPQISGPDAALLRMNLHGRHFVRSSTYSVRPISEPHDTGPRVDSDIWEITLEEFVKIPGNGFAELRIIFADGTSMDVADTTKIGRVLGLDILEAIIFAHDAGFSWDGCFDLSTIFVIDGVRAEIRAPYCDNCTEDAKANDLLSYVHWIIELFKVNGVLPAFFRHLEGMLKQPPRRPPLCNDRELQDFQQELYGYWDQVLTTLALRSSLARGGLFSGIHRIRRLAPAGVRDTLRVVLTSIQLRDDWRIPIGDKGHPVLKKVLHYIPGLEDGNNEKAKDEAMNRKYGTFKPDVGSLSMFPRQVNEHGNEHAKSKEDVKLQQGMVKQEKEQEQEPFKKLSELDLLTSHYLQDRLPIVLEAL